MFHVPVGAYDLQSASLPQATLTFLGCEDIKHPSVRIIPVDGSDSLPNKDAKRAQSLSSCPPRTSPQPTSPAHLIASQPASRPVPWLPDRPADPLPFPASSHQRVSCQSSNVTHSHMPEGQLYWTRPPLHSASQILDIVNIDSRPSLHACIPEYIRADLPLDSEWFESHRLIHQSGDQTIPNSVLRHTAAAEERGAGSEAQVRLSLSPTNQPLFFLPTSFLLAALTFGFPPNHPSLPAI